MGTRSPTRLDRDELVQAPGQPEVVITKAAPTSNARRRVFVQEIRLLADGRGACRGIIVDHTFEKTEKASICGFLSPTSLGRNREGEYKSSTSDEASICGFSTPMSQGWICGDTRVITSGGLLRVAESSTSDEASICGFSTPMSQGWICGDTRV